MLFFVACLMFRLRVTSQNTHSDQLVAGSHLLERIFVSIFESLVVIVAGCHQM